MAAVAMPLLALNLGCEMLFIIQQRLHAQATPAAKAAAVVADVARELCALAPFQPAAPAVGLEDLQQLLARVAGSSVMRLSADRCARPQPGRSIPPHPALSPLCCRPQCVSDTGCRRA